MSFVKDLPILEGLSPSGKREKTHLSPAKFGRAPFQAPHRWKRALELPVLGEEAEEAVEILVLYEFIGVGRLD